jgi:ubiquinone/menaquinone biosynthesis C-methylase UbiE
MNQEKLYSWIGDIAPLYDLLAWLFGYKKSVNFFISQIPFPKDEPIKILDAGCGTGAYSLAILKRYPRSSVIAFDFSEKIIEALKEKAGQKYKERLRLFSADIQSGLENIGDEKFNLIITSGVLEYVPPEKTIRNLSRFLVSGGYFLNSPVRHTLFGKIVCNLYGCRPYSREENVTAFINNEFSLEKIINLPWYSPASFKEAHLFKKQSN